MRVLLMMLAITAMAVLPAAAPRNPGSRVEAVRGGQERRRVESRRST
jgi:hypothetical protein